MFFELVFKKEFKLALAPGRWQPWRQIVVNPQSTGQPSWLPLNQTSKLDSHPGCHSIKPVNWTAILAVTQSNQSSGQPSWQPLNQTSQLDSHPGSHSIKTISGGPREDQAAAGPGSPRQPRGINFKASWELGITARTPTV